MENPSPAFLRFVERYKKNDVTGDTILNYGKHKGETLRDIYEKDPAYVAWFCTTEPTKYNTKAQTYFKQRIETDFDEQEEH